MRTITVVALFVLAGLLSILGNVGLWVDRTVYDSDTFVSTTDDVLDDPEVQQVIADRFAQELFVAADVDTRLREELPEGLKFLALPLTTASQEFLRNASLRLLERQPLEDVRNDAIEDTHARLIDVIEGRSDAVTTEGDALVLDLRPVLQRVATDVTGREIEVPRQGGAEIPEIPPDVLDRLPPDARERLESSGDDRLLPRAQLPPDAGRFVIEDSSIAWTFRIARYGNDIVYVILGITIACYVLAIAIARDRRSATRNAGIVIAAAGVISLALLLPVEYATREFAKNDAAATSVVDIVTEGYKQQSLLLVGFGVIIASVAALFGESAIALAIRSGAQRGAEGPSFGTVLRERATALRVAGFIAAALVLIVWPDPTIRVYVTTLALLAIYLAALFVVASDGEFARRIREEWELRRARWFGTGSDQRAQSWIGAHTGVLRAAGIALAVALLLFWPEPSLRFAVMVVALGLIYLAAVDLAAKPRSN